MSLTHARLLRHVGVVCVRCASTGATPNSRPPDDDHLADTPDDHPAAAQPSEAPAQPSEAPVQPSEAPVQPSDAPVQRAAGPTPVDTLDAPETSVPQDFRRVVSLRDLPPHQLPVKDIFKEREVWWDTEMSRPSIRERVFQEDPIDPPKPLRGLHKFKPNKKLRRVKKGHVANLDSMFLEAFEGKGGGGGGRETFLEVVQQFRQKSIRGYGFMEFTFTAMEYMKAFGVNKDVTCYNALLDTFPRGPMRQHNIFSTILKLGVHEQSTACHVLQVMAKNHILPDRRTLDILVDVFGPRADPTQLWKRQAYWGAKLRNLDPYPLPASPLPANPLDLARLGLERISDYDCAVTLMCGSWLLADVDPRWLLSAQNEEQTAELARLAEGSKLSVEGPFRQYLGDSHQHYFVLRGEAPESPVQPRTDEIEWVPEEHEDGYVFAIGMTGEPTEQMARFWVAELERLNPSIGHMYVVLDVRHDRTKALVDITSTEPTVDARQLYHSDDSPAWR